MDLGGANETDIREEIAMPMLTALGYAWGSSNAILRELPLKYPRIFLGRKKSSDPPIRGRPDYVLSVTGAGRWVLEVKAPSVEIQQHEIEQAITYARHPEVSATYAVILNGRRLVVYHASQRSEDDPHINVIVESPDELAKILTSTLSPQAIRRDCSPPKVDLNLPLANGLRSSAELRSGVISHSHFSWDSNQMQILPAEYTSNLDELCRRMRSFRTDITGGKVWRDSDSRIKAKLDWAFPHDDMMRFAQAKQLLDAEYVALGGSLSDDRSRPTTFDVVGNVRVEEGETLFDIVRWDTDVADTALSMSYRGQATGYIEDSVFSGEFQAEYDCTFPMMPSLRVSMYTVGDFTVNIDDR